MSEKISKRDFLKRLSGMGVLLATSSLPVIAEDDPSVFPKRGHFERLSISYSTINIGLKKPFSVMHFSDTHLTAAYPHENKNKQKLREVRTQTFGGRQEEALRDSLAWAKDHVDFLLHTGDIMDWQSEANFDLVKKYLGDNIFGSVGNHEFSPNMWLEKETYDEKNKDRSRVKLAEVFPFDISVQSQVINGVNFVSFDDVYATVTQKQSEIIKAEFKKGLPVILCMHVPFYTENIHRANKKFWSDSNNHDYGNPLAPEDEYKIQLEDPVTQDLIQFLKKQKLLKGILTGHMHITVEDKFSETANEYAVAGNFGFAVREVLFV